MIKTECPVCSKKELVHIEYNLFFCENCKNNFAYVDKEWMKEKRRNGELIFVTVKSSFKSPFSHRNSPTKSHRLSFGFY